MVFGSMPNDGQNLLLTTAEKKSLISVEPAAEKWIRPLLGAEEFINGTERWCLWLKDASPADIEALPLVKERVEKVRLLRLSSSRPATQRLAENPHLFGEVRHPQSGNYILVPRVSSERRSYVPVGFLSSDTISSDANQMIPNATLYEFGIVASEMHNDWMRTVAGRLKSDYRYSATLVYRLFAFKGVADF